MTVPFSLPIFDPNSPIFISLPVVYLVFQVLFLIAFALYVIYAFVIVRQVSLMARTVTAPLELLLKSLAWIHLGGAIIIWVFALMARV